MHDEGLSVRVRGLLRQEQHGDKRADPPGRFAFASAARIFAGSDAEDGERKTSPPPSAAAGAGVSGGSSYLQAQAAGEEHSRHTYRSAADRSRSSLLFAPSTTAATTTTTAGGAAVEPNPTAGIARHRPTAADFFVASAAEQDLEARPPGRQAESASRSKSRSQSHSRHRHHRRHHHHHHHHKHDRDDRHKASQSAPKRRRRELDPVETLAGLSNVLVDTRGQGTLYEFGAVYGLDVPVYPGVQIGKPKQPEVVRYFQDGGISKRPLKNMMASKRRLDRQAAGTTPTEAAPTFIAVAPAAAVFESDSEPEVNSDTENDADDVEQALTEEELQDRILAPRPNEPVEAFVRRKTKFLNQLVRQRPHDESAWLQLARWQDDPLQLQSRKAKAGQIDKQVAVFEAALKHHPQSVVLRLAMMRLLERNSTPDEAMRHWEAALQEQPNASALWLAYLRFCSSRYAVFEVESMRRSFWLALASIERKRKEQERLDAAAGISMSANSRLQAQHALCDGAMLDVFFAAVTFEEQSGYTERAVAMCQALLEFNLSIPPSLVQESSERRKELFAAYWMSEATRIGEMPVGDEIGGWAEWHEQNAADAAPEKPSRWGAPTDSGQAFDAAVSNAAEEAKVAQDQSALIAGCKRAQSADEAFAADAGNVEEPAIVSETQLWGDLLGANATPPPLAKTDNGAGGVSDSKDGGNGSATTASRGRPGIKYVYSVFHGYSIPMPVGPMDDDTSSMYRKILGEIRDAKPVAEAKSSAESTTDIYEVAPDDRLLAWAQAEDRRTASQWEVVKETASDVSAHIAHAQPQRTAEIEHIERYLFCVHGGLHEELVCRVLERLGVTVRHRASSNSVHARSFATAMFVPTGPMHDAQWLAKWRAEPCASFQFCDVDAQLLQSPSRRAWVRQVLCRASHALPRSVLLPCVLLSFEGQVAQRFVSAKPQLQSAASAALDDVARSVLSTQTASTNLLVWHAYADAKARVGNAEGASEVYYKALAIGRSMPPASRRHLATLHLALAQHDDAQRARQLHHLLCLTEPEFVSYKKAMKKFKGMDDASAAAALNASTRLIKARNVYRQWLRESAEYALDVVKTCVLTPSVAPSLMLQEAQAVAAGAVRWFMLSEWWDSKSALAWSPLCALVACCALIELRAGSPQAAVALVGDSIRLFWRLAELAARGQASSGASISAALRSIAMTTGTLLRPSVVPVPFLAVNTGGPMERVFDGACVCAEWLLNFQLRLVHDIPATPPRALRQLLEVSLACFPASHTFLGLYVQSEKLSTVSIRMRRFLDSIANHAECPVDVWAFSLAAELSKAETRLAASRAATGNETPQISMHRIRRLFEKAVATYAGQSTVLFWRWYIRFELACGSPARAKKVFYRAVASCPWSKALWLDCIRRLRPYFPADQLFELLGVMMQKQLFLREVPVK